LLRQLAQLRRFDPPFHDFRRAGVERQGASRAERLRQPVPFRFPAGAVIWVNLDPEVAAAVERQLTNCHDNRLRRAAATEDFCAFRFRVIPF
jgi:hypothetical protein